MAEYRRAEIISGSFIVLSVLVFGLFAFKVGGLSLDFLFREEGAEFVAYFDDVKTLDVQSKVAAGGLRVGFVKSLEPVALPWTAADLEALRDRGAPIDRAAVGRIRSQVKVTFVVTATDLRLGEDASARIEQEGFIGPFFVALDPGTWPADAPPPTVAAAGPRKTPLPTRGAGGIVDEALMMVRPTVRRIESILAKVDADLLAEENRDHLRNILPLLTGNLEEARRLLDRLEDLVDPAKPGNVHELLLQPTSKMIAELETTTVDLRAKIDAAWPQVTRLLEQGEATMASATSALERLRKFMDDADPNAQRLLRNLADGTADLRARLDVFEAMAAEARKLLSGAQPLVADLAGMTAENRANFAEMVRTFRNTAWELELAMRKIRANPAVLLFGDDEQDLSAEPRDASGLRRSGRARPYGQRDESERGTGK